MLSIKPRRFLVGPLASPDVVLEQVFGDLQMALLRGYHQTGGSAAVLTIQHHLHVRNLKYRTANSAVSSGMVGAIWHRGESLEFCARHPDFNAPTCLRNKFALLFPICIRTHIR